jgi:hypothetical protein
MAIATALALAFTVHATGGLFLNMSGVPVVRGSWFQYYEPGWSKGYFTTLYMEQKIDRFETGVVRYTFKSNDGRASGDVTYIPTPRSVKVEYRFRWSGDRKVLVELAAGLIWAPAVQNGKLYVGGVLQRSLKPSGYAASNGWTNRRYGSSSSNIVFDGPIGKLTFRSPSSDWTISDGRGVAQPWAESNDLLWLGIPSVEVLPGKTKHLSVEWAYEPKPQHSRTQSKYTLYSRRLPVARNVDQDFPLVPKPKEVKLDRTADYTLGSHPSLILPEQCAQIRALFDRFYQGLWEPTQGHSGQIVGSIAALGLPDEGYRIQISQQGVSVVGQSEAGLLNGLYTLALLASPHDGRLVVPLGGIRDWPSIDWRGIHMLVGPKALAFHRDLFTKALRPLKINRAVLQCERTAWEATKGIETSITMPREDLIKEFNMLRRIGIEPIPLIQSFGHTEWLFANDKNADIALNPDVRYALDPRNPRAQELLRSIWTEAIGILKPKTIHFGMDEVAIVGANDNPSFVSDLWDRHLPFLMSIASGNQVQPMIWGDVGLAKDQAIDACNGDSPEHAKRRRDALPKGTLVADWHYSANPDPKAFAKSLQLWKKEGKKPIASTWANPINIRSFVLAATRERCGALQTTWAGFESDWQNLYEYFHQYAAYVTFADYAWSGRVDEVDHRGYDSGRLLRRLLWGAPGNVTVKHGHAAIPYSSQAKKTRLGGYVFELFTPIALRSMIDPKQINAPTVIMLEGSIKGKELVLAVDCQARCEDEEPVARIEIELDNGKTISKTLLYGLDIRSQIDTASVVHADRSQGMSLIEIPLNTEEVRIKRINLRALNVYSGLRLRGITVY